MMGGEGGGDPWGKHKAEIVDGCCLLACSLGLDWFAFLYHPGSSGSFLSLSFPQSLPLSSLPPSLSPPPSPPPFPTFRSLNMCEHYTCIWSVYYMHAWSWRPEEKVGSPGIGVTVVRHSVGARNRIWVPWKSSWCA